MKKVLVLSAHHAPDVSRINQQAVAALSAIPGVTMHELWQAYPDYQINVEREQQLLRGHDSIVLLFPFWWYSSPAILKVWQDLVLTYGFAYGHEGTALYSKELLVMTSTGGPAEAYTLGGANLYPLETLLSPFRTMANKTGMTWLPPVPLHGANEATQAVIDSGVKVWSDRIKQLVASE